MSKSGPENLKMHSKEGNHLIKEILLEHLPSVVTEIRDEKGNVTNGIDIDLLKQELSGDFIEGREERYEFTWVGKKQSIVEANTPIQKTLRPCIEESRDWETTKNIYIEGDNLEALKLLQESYLNRIKMIYIDPPYNTGNDFIYSDRFVIDRSIYDEETGSVDEIGNRLIKNSKDAGRYHSDWCSMLYPRLKLAYSLLKDDGVILISIDDNEVYNLRSMMNEIFGEENFIAIIIWEKGRKNDARLFSVGHEYIIIFAKSVAKLRELKTIWREEKPGSKEIWEQYVELRKKFHENDKAIATELSKWFKDLPKDHPSKKLSRYHRVDKYGPWRDDNISWPGGGGPRYEVIHPITKLPCKVPERGWIFSTQQEMLRQISLGLVQFREDEKEPPFRKTHLHLIPDELDVNTLLFDDDETDEEPLAQQVMPSYFYKQSQVAVKYLRNLFGVKIFDNPKDHEVLMRLIRYITSPKTNEIIMDFFSGSAATAHAVMQLNAEDSGNRRYIMVQLQEPCKEKSEAYKAGFANISEIGKERIRLAGKMIIEEGNQKNALKTKNVKFQSDVDLGFRVFRVDDTNMKDVYYSATEYSQETIEGLIDNVKEGRTDLDLLYQVLIDWGLPLDLPHDIEKIDNFHIHIVDRNALVACFDANISESVMRKIAGKKPLRAVFRDGSFGCSPEKLNIEGIFKTIAPGTTLRVI